jgi:hypothetical protein
MRTLAELQAWRDEATRILGDPAETCGCAFFRYVRAGQLFASKEHDPDLVFSDEGDDLLLRFELRSPPLRISISRDGPKMLAGVLVEFGVDRIAPGLWVLNPSLNSPGVLHAFIALYDVPDPAPWEGGLIVLAG